MMTRNDGRLKQFINETVDANPTVMKLSQDVSVLKKDMTEVKIELHRQGILFEDMGDKIKIIFESMMSFFESTKKIHGLDETQKIQGAR